VVTTNLHAIGKTSLATSCPDGLYNLFADLVLYIKQHNAVPPTEFHLNAPGKNPFQC